MQRKLFSSNANPVRNCQKQFIVLQNKPEKIIVENFVDEAICGRKYYPVMSMAPVPLACSHMSSGNATTCPFCLLSSHIIAKFQSGF